MGGTPRDGFGAGLCRDRRTTLSVASVMSSGSGQLRPAAWKRLIVAQTVTRARTDRTPLEEFFEGGWRVDMRDFAKRAVSVQEQVAETLCQEETFPGSPSAPRSRSQIPLTAIRH